VTWRAGRGGGAGAGPCVWWRREGDGWGDTGEVSLRPSPVVAPSSYVSLAGTGATTGEECTLDEREESKLILGSGLQDSVWQAFLPR